MIFDQTFATAIERDIQVGNIAFLVGNVGIGKSSFIAALGHEKFGTTTFTVNCNQLADRTDLTGARLIPYTAPDGTEQYKQYFYPHATIMDAIDYARANPDKTVILCLDEVNRCGADITSALLNIPTTRIVGNIRLPENVAVICAGNDKGNVTALDDASLTRFSIYNIEPDVDTWMRVNPDANRFVKTVLENHPECIWQAATPEAVPLGNDDDTGATEFSLDEILGESDGMSQLTCPRTLTNLSRWLNLFDDKELLTMVSDTYEKNGRTISALQEVIEGKTGITPFTTFLLDCIASTLQNAMAQGGATASTITKPAAFDTLCACPTNTDLVKAVADLTDVERSRCFVYALYDSGDNASIIRALVQGTDNIQRDDVNELMLLSVNNRIDPGNLEAFVQTGSPLVQTLSMILNVDYN